MKILTEPGETHKLFKLIAQAHNDGHRQIELEVFQCNDLLMSSYGPPIFPDGFKLELDKEKLEQLNFAHYKGCVIKLIPGVPTGEFDV